MLCYMYQVQLVIEYVTVMEGVKFKFNDKSMYLPIQIIFLMAVLMTKCLFLRVISYLFILLFVIYFLTMVIELLF